MLTNPLSRENYSKNQLEKRKTLYLLTPDGFYFKTREGINFGPYQNLAQAKIARQILIDSICGSVSDNFTINSINKQNLIQIDHCIVDLPVQC